jgi:microcin C transport system substrate-binding protein
MRDQRSKRYLTIVVLVWVGAVIGALLALTPGTRVDAAEPTSPTGGEVFPKPDWKDALDPLASEDAVPGGDITYFLSQEPSSLNGYLDSFAHVSLIFGMMYESLLSIDPLTLDDTPDLAEKWAISADKKTLTFWIDARARWSDGQPITAHDVKATFDAIMASPRTGPTRLFLSRFDSPRVEGTHQIVFTAKQVHWNNLSTLGSFQILPRHVLETTKLDDLHFDFPVVSGPYRIGERRPGQYVTMSKRPDWWQRDFKRHQHKYNFNAIRFKFFAQQTNALEAFKKGEIDIYAVYMSRMWVEETRGEKFEKSWIVKQRIFNQHPTGFQGFALNMRRQPFRDVRVRQALGHLLDREKMNELLMYNVYAMHKSYYEDLYTADHPTPNPYTDYNVDKARTLLKAAGWAVNAATGKLEKDGKVFTVNFLARDETANRFLAIYRESLKQVGIELQVDMKDLAAWAKDMDAFNFDMTWAAWGAGLRRDPEQLWSGAEADRQTSSNITGFQDGRVDALIDKQRAIFDINTRNDILRDIDRLIYQAYPYLLLWYSDHTRLLYWSKFGTPDWVLSKYGNEFSAIVYWWLDEDSRLDLEAAMANGEALPKKPLDVRFDDVFTP